jgi:hypothetical protein
MSSRPTTDEQRPRLEDFLAGKPVSPRMAQLMRGEDEDQDTADAVPRRESYADGTPITKADREHLRRLLSSAGWQVLLKILDSELQRQEDAARRISLVTATSKEDIVTIWQRLAADKHARNRIVELAETEVEKLQKPAASS